MSVSITLEVPEDLAQLMSASGDDLARTALVALAVDQYRLKRISDGQFRRLLNVSRFEADAILKAHEVWLDYSLEDFERDGESLRELREREP